MNKSCSYLGNKSKSTKNDRSQRIVENPLFPKSCFNTTPQPPTLLPSLVATGSSSSPPLITSSKITPTRMITTSSGAATSFDHQQSLPSELSTTHLPEIGESAALSQSSPSSLNRITSFSTTITTGQRSPSVPADGLRHNSRTQRRRAITSSSGSSAAASNNPTNAPQPVTTTTTMDILDEDTTLFVNTMKTDLTSIQKLISEQRYEEKYNSHSSRSDDMVTNFSSCIYHNDHYRTRYALLELFVDKLSELQQHLMHKTDKLIPVSKRFKPNNYEKKGLSIRLQRFVDVSDRIMDVVENSKPQSISTREKVVNKETQTAVIDLPSSKPFNSTQQAPPTKDTEVDMNPLVENNVYEEEVHALKKLLTELQLEKEQALKTVKEMSETISSIRTEKCKEFEDVIGQLKKDLEILKQEKTEMLKTQEEIGDSHLEADVTSLEEQLSEKESKIENLESMLYFKGKEIESIQEEVNSMKSRLALQKEKDEIETWKVKYQELTGQYQDLELLNRDLRDEHELLKDTARKEDLRFKETIHTMQDMHEHQTRANTETHKQDIKKLQSKLEAAEKIAMQKEFQYEELVKNYQILSIELGISGKQQGNLKEQVKTLQREKQQLLENVVDRDQSVDVRQEIEKIKKEYTEKSNNLNEKMKDLQMGHILQLKALNDTFTQERKMLQRKADKFKQRSDLLEERLESLERE